MEDYLWYADWWRHLLANDYVILQYSIILRFCCCFFLKQDGDGKNANLSRLHYQWAND